MRQSAAHSRHQLLPVPGVCAACKWCIAASRWCSDVNVSNGAYGPRSPTQTRPFSSVSALVAAAFGPAVGSAACRVRSGDTRAACIRTRAAGAAFGCTICSSSPWQSTAWQAQQGFAATADQQPTHAASRWCSDATVSNGACGPRSPTQTRPLSSVSALVAAAFGPAVGSAACRVRPGDSRAACIETRAAGAASGCGHLLR